MSQPEVSYVNAMNVWMGGSMMMVFLVLIEFAVVNTVARAEQTRLSREMVDPKPSNGALNGALPNVNFHCEIVFHAQSYSYAGNLFIHTGNH